MNFIYGLVPVLEALRAGKRSLSRIVIATSVQPSRLNELIKLAKEARVSLERRERKVLDEMSRGANHQGVIALIAGAPASARKNSDYASVDDILDSPHEIPLVVLLDSIEDPHNLGAILRSCEAAGVDGVFIPEHRAVGLTETVAKTSAGAVEYIRVARVTNLVTLITELKKRGFWVIGVEGGTTADYTEFDMNVPLALVLGSEGQGIRRLVKENCDVLLSIPMHGKVNSLNVSVATGIVLFEALRQRKQ